MMTSSQIAQANSYQAFDMGYGGMNPTFGREQFTGMTPFGPGTANQFGANMLSGTSSFVNAAQLAGFGAFLGAGALNKLGLGGRVATGLGRVAAMTGMTLPAALSLGVLTPAVLGLSGLATGARQQAQVMSEMNQTFGNRDMGGRFGFGISQAGARKLTESMRRIADTPEMMSSFNELSSIMSKLNDMQIMQGVRDANDYQRKFKGMITALRDMSRSLNTTMEEALPFLQSSVRAGFLDPADMRRNVELTGARANIGVGIDRGRLFREQEQSGEMIRRQGGSSQVGSEGIANLITTISMARRQNLISDADLQQTTGQIGDEGTASLARQLFQGQNRLFSQGVGRFVVAGLGERDEQGNFTGRLNADRLSALQRGEVDSIISQGQSALSNMSDENALSFQNAISRGMGANAGALAGPQGINAVIEAIVREAGIRGEQAKRTLLRSLTGMRQDVVDELLKISENSNQLMPSQQELQDLMMRSRMVSAFKEHGTISGAMHHIGTALRRETISRVYTAGGRASERMGNVFEDFQDRFITSGFGGKLGELARSPLTLLQLGAAGFGGVFDINMGGRRFEAGQGVAQQGAAGILSGSGALDGAMLRERLTSGNNVYSAVDDLNSGIQRGGEIGLVGGAGVGAMLAAGALLTAPVSIPTALVSVATGIVAGAAKGGVLGSAFGGSIGLGAGLGRGYDLSDAGKHNLARLVGSNQTTETINPDAGIEELGKKLGKGRLTVRALADMDLEEMLAFLVRELEYNGLSPLNVLEALSGGSEDRVTRVLAGKIRRFILRRLMSSGGDKTISASAEERIEEARSEIADIFDDAETTLGIVSLENTDRNQATALIQMLSTQEGRDTLERANNANMLGPIAQQLNIDTDTLRTIISETRNLSVDDMAKLGVQNNIIRQASTEIGEDALSAKLSMISNNQIGRSIRQNIRSPENLAKIVSNLRPEQTREDPILNALVASFTNSRRSFRGNSERDILEQLDGMGLGDQAREIFSDANDSVSDTERRKAQNLLATSQFLTTMISDETSEQSMRQRRTGGSEMGEAMEAARARAETEYVDANRRFVTAVADAIPRIRDTATALPTPPRAQAPRPY